MSCANCSKQTTTPTDSVSSARHPVSATAKRGAVRTLLAKHKDAVLADATAMDLKQCYLCAKKHLSAAKILFREYHNGYSAHIKNLINSMRVSEDQVRSAFLKWQDIMAELNMAENELLGNDGTTLNLLDDHLTIASRIRAERLALSDSTTYVPRFDDLLVMVHELQFRSLN